MTLPDPKQAWLQRLRRWLVAEPQLSPRTNRIAQAVLEPLQVDSDDPQAVRNALAQGLRELDDVRAGLLRLQTQVEAHTSLQAQWQRFDSAAWGREIARLRQHAPARRHRAWKRLFCAALAAWRLDACRRLLEPGSTPEPHLAARFACGLNALTHAPAQAAGWLEGLCAGDGPASEEGPDTCCRLAVLKARLQMRAQDDDGARVTLSLARQWAAAPSASAWVDAAFGELMHRQHHSAAAVSAFQEALSKAPELPDPCSGLAAIAATEGRWEDVDEWVGRAVDRAMSAPDALWMLERLQAPLSVRLLRRLGAQAPADEARAFERACALEIDAVGAAARSREYELRAQWKRERGQPAQADFIAASNECLDVDPARAAALREQASPLTAADQAVLWHWADALYLQSYRAPPQMCDGPTLQRALQVWERGAALAAPQPPFAWAWLTRAVIAERQADLETADFESLIWQAVRWAERGLLVDDTQSHAWSTLCRLHRALDNNECALQAARRGVELAPDDPVTLEELLIILVNTRRFDEASKLITRWRELGETGPWIDAVQAHVLLYATEAEGPLRERLQHSLALTAEASDRWSWMYRDRARACLRLGDVEGAQAECERLVKACEQPTVDERPDTALALMLLGRHDQALSVLQQSREAEPTRRDDTDRLTGLVHLLRGELEPARQFMQSGIDATVTATTLHEWEVGPAEDVRIVLSKAQEGEAQYLLATMVGLARGQAQRLPALDNPVSELLQRLQQSALFTAGSSHRCGALAVLARLHCEAGQHDEALRCYDELAATDRDLAALGQVRTLQCRFDSQGSLPAGAHEALTEAMRSAEPAASRAAQLAMTAHLRRALSADSDAAALRRGTQAALELALGRAAGEPAEAAHALMSLAVELAAQPNMLWRLDDALDALARQGTPAMREAARTARNAMPDALSGLLGLAAGRARTAGFLYRVGRLRLYLGRELRARAEANGALKQRWNSLRERALEQWGIALPELHLERMADESGLALSYCIAIDDLQLPTAQAPSDGAIDAVIADLEAVLRARSTQFLGLADVDEWLSRQHDELPADLTALGDRMRADRSRLQALARLLRALADERVPLVRRADILSAFDASFSEGHDAMLRRARSVLMQDLPGQGRRCLQLAQDEEDELLAWFVVERGRGYLAMPPQEVQSLLAAVRNLLDDASGPAALCVRRPELRAPLRQVVAFDHPDLPVLAADELPAEREPA